MKLPEQTEMNYKTRKPKRVETETGYRIGDTEYRTRFSCSDELCEYMSDFSNGNVILAFSTGKDSIVAWLKLKRYFKNIIPYYRYLVPNLDFVEKSLRYYEDWFGTHIMRLPHPSLYRLWNNFVVQAPENLRIIEEAHLMKFTYSDLGKLIRATDPALVNAYQASGVRSADSINRRTSVLKYGSVNHNEMTFMPVFDYKKEDMLRELDAANIALPIDYVWFGRTFDGIDRRFTEPLREFAPKDFEKVRECFPLLEMDILRNEFRKEYWANEAKKGA
ncbi:hypothetical protein AGMMS49992_20270 [Clostridia bacterium]|nr:hypothetical protein AGMMS49992_20270 [Clostridia bacterium]